MMRRQCERNYWPTWCAKMSDTPWQRLPIISIGHQTWLFSIRILKDIGLTIWLWVSLFLWLKSIPLVVLSMATIVVGLGLLVCSLRWYYFEYRFTDDSVEIQSGVFARTNKKIPYRNVINVEINRPFLFRLTNYVEAIFDSAGHSQKDGLIPCIEQEKAESIKSRCVLQPVSVNSIQDQDSHVLVRRNNKELFLFGMAHNRVFLFLGLMVGLYFKIHEVVQDLDTQLLKFYEAAIAVVHPVVLGSFGVMMLLIASSALSGLIQVMTGYRYTLWQEDDVLKQQEGLFSKHESTLKRQKLQRVVLRRTILDRLVGRGSVELVQLNGSMVVPALTPSEAIALCKALNVNIPAGALQRGGFYSSMQWSVIWSIPLLFLAYQALVVERFGFVYGFVGFCVAILIFSALRWYRFGFAVDDTSIVVKTGRFDERTYIAELLKCQATTISQSWIERWMGTASVRLHFVMKTLVLKGIDQQLAERVRNQCLAAIEMSKKWF